MLLMILFVLVARIVVRNIEDEKIGCSIGLDVNKQMCHIFVYQGKVERIAERCSRCSAKRPVASSLFLSNTPTHQ